MDPNVFHAKNIDRALGVWLGTQFTQPNPDLGPLQGVFGT